MNNNNFGPRPSFSVSPSTVLKQSSHLLLTSALTKKKQQQWHSYKLSLWVFIQLFSAIFWAAFKHTHFSCLHKCNHKLDSECTQQKIMTRLLSMQTADMMLRLVLRCNANHILIPAVNEVLVGVCIIKCSARVCKLMLYTSWQCIFVGKQGSQFLKPWTVFLHLMATSLPPEPPNLLIQIYKANYYPVSDIHHYTQC